MDKLSHSQKNYNVNTMYDDVFGGPPKFGIPTRTTTTLSPRVDDYGEIFGGVHAPRATSIPVLDLPVVDEAEVFFDVRSSGFDYDEVFGEESNSDFAVSFEELIDQTNGRDHFSSDEAWTPEAEYLSEESDHSVKDGDSLSGDSPESVHGRTEFNISYHQVGQRGNENMENVITQVFQRTLPDCTSVVDHTESLQMMDGECSSLQQADDVCFGNSAFVSSERKKERDLRKTLSQPAHGGIYEPQYLHVGRPHEGYVRSSSFPNESFFTISDVSLRTLPSQLPPPSRPPPPTALDARQGSYRKSTQDYKWFGSDGSASESSPPSFDEVVGASSYAQASAAAILEAMEKAEARMKSAKESMGRKNEVFYNHKNLCQKNKRENYYGKVTRSFDNHSITAETSQGTGERMGNQMAFFAFSENRKLNKEDAVISESLEGKRRQTVDKSSEDEKHGRESMSSQGPYKTDKAPQWKKETDLELVSTDKFGKLFDQKSNQENVTSILNSWNAMQKSGIKEPSTQNRHGKTYSVDQKSSGSDRRQTGFGDSRKCENIVEDHYQDSEVEDKKNQPKKEKPELKEAYRSMGHQKNFSFEYEDSDNRQRGSFEGEMEERQNPMHGQMEDERMLDDKIRQEKMENIEVSGWEENKEKTRQSYEENNQKKLKEIPLKQDGTEGVKESLFNKLEGKEKRLGKTCENTEEKMKKQGVPKPENEREEHENRFKKIPEREGNELRQKDLNSRIEKEMRGRGVFGKDFTEARIEESRREIGDELKEVNEYDRKSKSWQAVQQEEESEMGLQKNPDELGSTVEEIINLQETGNLFNNAFESMKQKRPDEEGGDCSLSNEQSASGIHNGVGRPRVIGGTLVGDEQNALLETKKFPTEPQNDNFEAAIRRSRKTKVENRNGSNMIPDVATQGKQPANEHLEEGQNIGQTHVYLNHGDKKGGVMSSRVVKASSEHIRNKESQKAKLEVKESSQQIPQPAFVDKSNERKVKSLNETSEGKEAEKIRREKELEQLRKMEEDIDREREREKDRMDFDRTELEARERAERAAVERAMNEARQRLEKTSVEARLKVERSAVERATAEARERVLEKIMAENASKERDRDHQYQSAGSFEGSRYASSSNSNGIEGESVQRCRARLERQRRTAERAEKALAEKTKRDLLAQKEQAERNRIAETLDAEVKRWSSGKEGNLRALLSTLQYILGPNSGWQPIPLTEVIASAAVKRAYRKAMLCVHPDKLLQKRASIQQKYICEKVFDLLKEAWNKFNSEER